MNSGDFWQNLKEDWHSASPEIDVPALRRQVDRKRRRMLALTVLDFVLAPIMTAVLAWMWDAGRFGAGSVAPSLLMAIIWISALGPAWLRFSTLRTREKGAAGMLRLTIRRARAGLHFIWLSLVLLLAVYAVATPMFRNMWASGMPARHGAVLGSIVSNGFFFLCVVIWGIWYGRRQRRKIRRAEAMLLQLEQENGGVR